VIRPKSLQIALTLHVYGISITVSQPGLGTPAVLLHFAEKLVVDHHAGTALAMMIQFDKSTISVLVLEIGPGLWQNMRVTIDLDFDHGFSCSARQYPRTHNERGNEGGDQHKTDQETNNPK
jgi:hypothetical protein